MIRPIASLLFSMVALPCCNATHKTPLTKVTTRLAVSASYRIPPNLSQHFSRRRLPPRHIEVASGQRPPINWPQKEPVRIDALDVDGLHLVVLTSDGKRTFSVSLKFSEYNDSNLCIYFDGYQGVGLGNTRDALWCKVKNAIAGHNPRYRE